MFPFFMWAINTLYRNLKIQYPTCVKCWIFKLLYSFIMARVKSQNMQLRFFNTQDVLSCYCYCLPTLFVYTCSFAVLFWTFFLMLCPKWSMLILFWYSLWCHPLQSWATQLSAEYRHVRTVLHSTTLSADHNLNRSASTIESSPTSNVMLRKLEVHQMLSPRTHELRDSQSNPTSFAQHTGYLIIVLKS